MMRSQATIWQNGLSDDGKVSLLTTTKLREFL